MADPQAPSGPQLHDIHLPTDPSWWPPAIGWWVLLLSWTVMLLLFASYFYRWYQLVKFRKSVLRLLDEIEQPDSDQDRSRYLSDVSVLLRRVARHAFPKTDIAPLTGSQWLMFLDKTGGGTAFSRGVGQVLEVGPYVKKPEYDAQQLHDLVRRWITNNLGKRP